MQWPPDYTAEFNRRAILYSHLASDAEALAAANAHYANNPVDWINDFCVTYDPRVKSPMPKTMPFLLFQRQRELVQCIEDCIQDGESLLVEKSRDMGASWVCVAYSIHQWKYKDGVAFGWGSRKQEYVDKLGDSKTLFEKMRILLDHLPEFMLPVGFKPEAHATFMRVINPANGSNITGEAGDNIGRGGRTTAYFKDESAHYERPEKIEAALGDNTDVQIDISSVNGIGNVFYRRRKAGEVWYPGKSMTKNRVRIFIMDWSDHPGKDQAWYDAKREKADREGLLVEFAQETDRDYASSVDRLIIEPKWVKAAIDAHKKLAHFGDFTGAKVSGLDVADEGIDKNAQAFVNGVILEHCEDWSKGDGGETARHAVRNCVERGYNELFYDCIGVGAAIKAETNRMRDESLMPKTLLVLPWNASSSGKALLHPEKNIIPGDKNSPKNKDHFASLSAQSYFLLAQRFYKTYKAVTIGRRYDPGELISLSSEIEQLEEMVSELSQATQGETGTGKMQVNKKPAGTKSPNMADSIKMAFCPMRKGVNYSKLVRM